MITAGKFQGEFRHINEFPQQDSQTAPTLRCVCIVRAFWRASNTSHSHYVYCGKKLDRSCTAPFHKVNVIWHNFFNIMNVFQRKLHNCMEFLVDVYNLQTEWFSEAFWNVSMKPQLNPWRQNPEVHHCIHKCPPKVLNPEQGESTAHPPPQVISLRSVLIPSSHLRLDLPSGLFQVCEK
jgi:hypothetical protein